MPALDPFSAASRPMLPFDTLPSRPLPFAATLHPIDLNDAHNLSLQKLPKARRHREPAPKSFPLPQYRQSPLTSMALHQNGVNPVVVGSDEWMQAEIARCVDSAKGDLDISKKGLKVLSTKIIDLRDLVTLPTSFSPLASTFSRRGPTSESSPLLHNPQPSPGSGHLSANARAFSRTTSAPASVAVFTTTHSQRQQRSSDRGRAVSGPSHREFRLHSPTPTETSEDEMEESNADAREVTSSPSLPAPSNTETHMQGLRTRAFGRSKTGAVSFNPNMASGKGRLAAMDISIYAASNYLTSLPSALFEISNLTFLSLRAFLTLLGEVDISLSHFAGGNQLTVLPGAIGHLHNLKELNISNNQITELPSTILNLTLTQFSALPNPFLPCPHMMRATTSKCSATSTSSDAVLTTSVTLTVDSPSSRILAPLISSNRSAVPRLSALCLNLLISPCRPTGLPPLLDAYDWETPAKGQLHPLLDVTTLHQLIPNISVLDLGRLLQALKSAGATHSRTTLDLHLRGADAPVSSVTQLSLDPFPRSNRDAVQDDASANPWYYPCPSPRHLEYDVSSIRTAFKRDRHLFLHPAEERIEWREVFGITGLPVKWLGCCPGCLAFLVEEEGADWDMDQE